MSDSGNEGQHFQQRSMDEQAENQQEGKGRSREVTDRRVKKNARSEWRNEGADIMDGFGSLWEDFREN